MKKFLIDTVNDILREYDNAKKIIESETDEEMKQDAIDVYMMNTTYLHDLDISNKYRYYLISTRDSLYHMLSLIVSAEQ